MAPSSIDENHLFLYHCLQNSSGEGKVCQSHHLYFQLQLTSHFQIDTDAVATAIGSTKGAVAVRLRRLKEKIEGSVTSGLVEASTPAKEPAKKASKKGAEPKSKKRKISAEDDVETEATNGAVKAEES